MNTEDLVNMYAQLSVAAPLLAMVVLLVIGFVTWREVNRW
jgi:hypothetical protein